MVSNSRVKRTEKCVSISRDEELLEKYERMKENGFHLLENKFPLPRIRSVFKKWFPLISVTVSADMKEFSTRVEGFH